MIYFENSRTLSVGDLYKVVNEDGDRIYSDDLLKKIQSGNFNCLNEINLVDRNNRYFMEPILFAVKNSEFSTYEVFKYYGEELQKQDLTIATEIVVNEPEVLEDTAITDNSKLVLYFAKINPSIILYISEDLKSNGEFIEELCKTGNKEAIAYAISECNILEVLQDNPNLASNPEFIKEACKSNNNVINYVAEHANEISVEALVAAQEVLRENFNIKVIEECREESIRLHELIEQQKEQGKEPDYRLVAKASRIEGRPEMLDARLEGLEKGDPKSIRYAERMLKICKNMNKDDREMLEQGLKIGRAIAEKQREETKENKENDINIKPQDIEKVTKGIRTSDINRVTTEIREEYTLEEKEVGSSDRGTKFEERT